MKEEKDSSQERSEKPSYKKLRESREKGSVARSRDFNSALSLFLIGSYFLLFGKSTLVNIKTLFLMYFSFEIVTLDDVAMISILLKKAMFEGLFILLPIAIIAFLSASLAPLLVGGWTFAISHIEFNFERLDPVKGLGKLFSMKGLIELLKSVVKIILVGMMALIAFIVFFKKIVFFSFLDVSEGLEKTSYTCGVVFLMLSGALLVFSFFDIPLQLFMYFNQLKMTKQEVKDEHKETEGNPHLKSKMNSARKELSKKRMMVFVPKADVIITNPTHFALAIQYDEKKMQAPLLVGKGVDLVAQHIITIAKKHDIPVVRMPNLARSIYYHTEVGEEIPSQLYMAVAQILAYVYQLRLYKKGKRKKPTLPNKVNIPSNMIR